MLHLSIPSVTPERLECVPAPARGSISSYFCPQVQTSDELSSTL